MSKDITLMVQGDHSVWVNADSMIEYLRKVVEEGRGHGRIAYDRGDPYTYTAAMAVSDAVQQIADGLAVTCMEAHETVRGKRVPG